MTIEVLYFDGCPNHERLLEHLPRLLEREGIVADIALRPVKDLAQAERERFLGSPTIRVDGRDVDPGAEHRYDSPSSSRNESANRCVRISVLRR
jgi:hypothetical protein